jgi:succinate-semialdehyde dehydrogenase/glutarate-semialdehyde dehydrogenase
MISINPATLEPAGEYPEHSPAQIEYLLQQARDAFPEWRHQSFEDRAVFLREAARLLRDRKEELAKLMAGEMGKPITAGEQEIDKCAGACEFFAEHAGGFLAAEEIASDASKSFIRFDPLGPVLAIMPWNFPFWQVFRFAAPALMAGNVGLLKHAPNVPGCALAIEKIFSDAGLPFGVFTTLLVAENDAAQKLVDHPVIKAVTLTGSERAGSAVGAAAGRALKKTVMELGGSDAFIVLSDANIEAVAKSAAEARCINSGQSCIAAKRFIVEESIAEEFEAAMTAAMVAMKMGDPLDRSTQMGPLARLDLLENLDRQVQASIAAGARLLGGGNLYRGSTADANSPGDENFHRNGNPHRAANLYHGANLPRGADRDLDRALRKGYFFPPTVLADVKPGMPAFDEETFGPVAAIIRATSANDAVRLANLSSYGLGCSIWTTDLKKGEALAAEIDAGSVFINGIVKSDSRLPFGGIKRSGWGRELSQAGIREFVNIKTVWIGPGDAR